MWNCIYINVLYEGTSLPLGKHFTESILNCFNFVFCNYFNISPRTVAKMTVSSAKWRNFTVQVQFENTVMYIVLRPKSFPCGIPYSTSNSSLFCSSIINFCILFDRYDLMRSWVITPIPMSSTTFKSSMINSIKGFS